jgi:hypothetical protein
MRRRFWVAVVASGCSSLLFIVTLGWPEWIELWFGVDPDRGNGSVEWLIVSLSAVAAIIVFAIAAMEWRCTHTGRTVEAQPDV